MTSSSRAAGEVNSGSVALQDGHRVSEHESAHSTMSGVRCRASATVDSVRVRNSGEQYKVGMYAERRAGRIGDGIFPRFICARKCSLRAEARVRPRRHASDSVLGICTTPVRGRVAVVVVSCRRWRGERKERVIGEGSCEPALVMDGGGRGRGAPRKVRSPGNLGCF